MMVLKILRKNLNFILSVLFPIVLSLIFLWEGENRKKGLIPYKQPHCAFVMMLMSFYWMTECIPLAVTSFLPVILFPLLGVSNTEAVANQYLNKTILFLLGGCLIALSFEYSNLHRRIALKVIVLVGAKISNLLFGIMLTSMSLSMWMNNTSTTAMMIPIVTVIMHEFEKKIDAHAKTMERMTANAHDEEEPVVFIEENMSLTNKFSNSEDQSNGRLDSIEKEVAGSVEISNSENVSASMNPPESAASLQLSPDEASSMASSKYELPNKTQSTPSTRTTASAIKREKTVAEQVRHLKCMFLIATAYAANIGGTGVITGSGTNVVALDLLDIDLNAVKSTNTAKDFWDSEKCSNGEYLVISFPSWMQFNVVTMVLNMVLTWLYLQIHFLGFPRWMFCWRKTTQEDIDENKRKEIMAKNIHNAIKSSYEELGPMSMHEFAVMIIFVCMACIWFLRNPRMFPGWMEWFPLVNHDATPTLMMCFLLFVIPKKLKYFKTIMNGGLREGLKDPLLTWKFVSDKLPWGPFLLLGGGGAMSKGLKDSGLDKIIGKFLEENELIRSSSKEVILIIVMLMVACLTTVASNTATAAIIVPVLIQLSMVKQIHPLYLVITTSVSASYAFMLPVSTPPNAIVFDQSDMTNLDMIYPGFFVTIICNIVLYISVNTFLSPMFRFNDYEGMCNSCGDKANNPHCPWNIANPFL